MALLGLDIGTTGCKSTIISNDGRICAYTYMEYGIETPSPGLYELNPDVVWNSVKYVIATSAKKYSGEKIGALCISSFGEAAVPVNKKGEILHNSLLYTDFRGTAQAAFSHPILNKKMLENNYACVPHAKNGMYITYAFNFTGGSLLKWYRDNFAFEEKYESQKIRNRRLLHT